MNTVILYGIVSLITCVFIIVIGLLNKSLECDNRKDNYVDEKKYPEQYFQWVWISGIVVLLLTSLMMFIEKFFPFWCFIVNVWLVTNAGFYDMQIERCNDNNMSKSKIYANKFFIAWGSIIMILIVFLKGLKFCYNKE